MPILSPGGNKAVCWCPRQKTRWAQSTQDMGRDARANLNVFPLMLLACSVDTPIHINRSYLLVLCCTSYPASCVDWASIVLIFGGAKNMPYLFFRSSVMLQLCRAWLWRLRESRVWSPQGPPEGLPAPPPPPPAKFSESYTPSTHSAYAQRCTYVCVTQRKK